MCCSSLMCPRNWPGPTINMYSIITEVINNIKLLQRIMEIIHLNKITDKYFGFYLPIEEFL